MDLTQGRLEALAHPARVAMVRLLAELPDEHTLRDPRCGTAYGVSANLSLSSAVGFPVGTYRVLFHRYPISRSFRLTVPGWKVTKKRLSKASWSRGAVQASSPAKSSPRKALMAGVQRGLAPGGLPSSR